MIKRINTKSTTKSITNQYFNEFITRGKQYFQAAINTLTEQEKNIIETQIIQYEQQLIQQYGQLRWRQLIINYGKRIGNYGQQLFLTKYEKTNNFKDQC